eukprot:Pompholyxophrys_punicea_v1_NODE_862_length_1197_cov_2.602452.p1 type:complete len:105 gc:universal NODE_862_length_1197_cov_2.602452:509-195(-)
MHIKCRFDASKKIVVILGAGASVAAGIPAFVGPEGQYSTYGERSFHSTERNSPTFLKMVADIYSKAVNAKATVTHKFLAKNGGKIQHVYTQNIDSLETKCGLER